MDLVSVDPGEHPGYVGWFRGQLVYASRLPPLLKQPPDEVIVELPKAYPKGQGPKGRRIDPNDLITLAFRAGVQVADLRPIAIRTVLPSGWKKQLPKDICWSRCQALLTSEELSIIPENAPHDVRDAIGIGLWYLKRFRP